MQAVIEVYWCGEYDKNVAGFCNAVLELRGIDNADYWFSAEEEEICGAYLKEVCNVC
jgi:hypothetical protein